MHLKWLTAVNLLTILGLSLATPHFESQLPFSAVRQQSLEEIRQALIKAHIISDALDDFLPSCYLRVFYTSSQEQVWLGNKIQPAHAKKAPAVQVFCPNVDALRGRQGLTVALSDPDAPSRKNPKWSEMCHWIAMVKDEDNGVVEGFQEVEDLVEYKPPGPPSKTGYHRYVFVLLQGDNGNLTRPTDREHWGTGKQRHGVRDWAQQEGLNVVGANFFYAKFNRQ